MMNKAIDHQAVPVDENGLYLIFTGPGVSINYYGYQYCVHFCGFHTVYFYSEDGIKLKFAVIGWPDESCYQACDVKADTPNFNPAGDTVVRVAAHEIIESITDPEGPVGNVAWLDEMGNEVADKCIYTYGDVSFATSANGDYYYNTQIGERYYLLQQSWRLPTQDCGLTDSSEGA
mmetsp:Transcript_7823/g.12513  ORF Transcript_7823/g.12513 Transcript_7823/m.12513 type:complete len:175 (+) Transcript_7823:1-525(+)